MKKLNYQWYLFTVRRGNEEKVANEIKKWENYPTYIRDLKIVPEWSGYLLCQCSSIPETEKFFYQLNRNTNLRIGKFLSQPVSPFLVKNLLAKIKLQKKPREPKPTNLTDKFKIGDLVKIKSINQEGRIIYLNERKREVNIKVENSGAEIANVPLASCQKVFG
ncbi:MAG: hypothetical protein MRERC_5c100 [Mycoplasmataceae bacterium RC_NB112A]|nr:MAG: hypothetical protein MRERC_5c100 [Mycoplasmataceae bacterium RC_NB112A]